MSDHISNLLQQIKVNFSCSQLEELIFTLLASHSPVAIKAGLAAIQWLVAAERFEALPDIDKNKVAFALLSSCSRVAIEAGLAAIRWLVAAERFEALSDIDKNKIAFTLLASGSSVTIKASLAAIQWLIAAERFEARSDTDKNKIVFAVLASQSSVTIEAGMPAIQWLLAAERFEKLLDSEKEQILHKVLSSNCSVVIEKIIPKIQNWLINYRTDFSALEKMTRKISFCNCKAKLYPAVIEIISILEEVTQDHKVALLNVLNENRKLTLSLKELLQAKLASINPATEIILAQRQKTKRKKSDESVVKPKKSKKSKQDESGEESSNIVASEKQKKRKISHKPKIAKGSEKGAEGASHSIPPAAQVPAWIRVKNAKPASAPRPSIFSIFKNLQNPIPHPMSLSSDKGAISTASNNLASKKFSFKSTSN